MVLVYNSIEWEQNGANGSNDAGFGTELMLSYVDLCMASVLLMTNGLRITGGEIYMAAFVDEYERQLDERGRIILPSKLRECVSGTVYITQSTSEKCLHLYTEEEWNKVAEKVNQLPTATDVNAAAFVRLFFGKATSVTVDKQGRIPIAKRLIDFAGLSKDVVLVGANTRLEIWDSAYWSAYQEKLSESFMAENILKYNLNI